MAEQKIGTANIEIGVKSTVPQDLEASKKSLKDFASTTKQASQEVEKSMVDASSAVAKMETSSDNLSRAQKRTADSIIRSSERLSAGSKAAYLDWVAAQAGVTNATQAARDKLRQWENQQAESVSAGRKYIQMLKEQTETLGMNRRELMQYQAAQLGVSDQAAPLINKMFDTSKSFTAVEMSAKQTRQAMRLLPAQITDVVTSLASGMPFYLVAIQQGGQLRDSFGGFGNVLKGVAALISPMAVAIGGLAAAGAAAYYSYDAFTGILMSMNRTLIETGNFAGVTSSQMAAMAESIAADVGTQKQASQALNAIVSSQALVGQSYEMIGQAAVAWSKATGASVDEVVKKFVALGENPAEAMVKLTREMNFLTMAQYEQVAALLEQGNKTEASRMLIEALANTMNQRAPEMREQVSLFADMWDILTTKISKTTEDLGKFIDKMITGGSTQDQYNTALKTYFDIMAQIEQLEVDPSLAPAELQALYAQRDAQQQILAGLNERVVAQQKSAQAQAEQNALVQAGIALDKARSSARDYIKNLEEEYELIGLTNEARMVAIGTRKLEEMGFKTGSAELEKYLVKLREVAKNTAVRTAQIEASKKAEQQAKKEAEEYRKMIDSADKMVEALAFETRALEMTNDERELAIQLRRLEALGIKEGTDLYAKYAQTIMDTMAANQAIKDRLEAEKKFQKDRLKQEEDYAKQVEQINNQIGQSLTDALMQGGMNAKEFLINMFKTLVLRPILQPIITGMVGSLGAGAASVAMAGGGDGGTSSLSMASSLKSAYDMFSGGFASAGAVFTDLGVSMGSQFIADFGYGFGTGFTTGSGVTANAGAMLGAAANAAAGIAAGIGIGELISGGKSAIGGNSLFATGGGTAIGAAIGSIVPGIGTAIGASVGGILGGVVNAAFGSGAKEYTDSGISGTLKAMGADLQEYSKWKKAGGWFTSTKRGTELRDASAQLQSAVDGALNGVATSVAFFAGALGQPTDAIRSFSQAINISFKDLSEAEIQAEIQKAIKGFESGLIAAVFPTLNQFAYVGEEAGATLKRLSERLGTVNSVFNVLGFRLQEISLKGADAANTLIELTGGIESFTQKADFYYQNFYTAQERTAKSTAELASVFNQMGIAMPTTREAFRAIMEVFQQVGTPTQVAVMLNIASSFNEYVTATEAAKKATDDLIAARMNEAYTIENAIYQMLGDTVTLRQREMNGINEANRALQQHVYTMEDAKAAYEASTNAVSSAFDALKQAIAKELKAELDALAQEFNDFTATLTSQQNALQIAQQVANESMNNLKGIFDYLSGQISDLMGTTKETVGEGIRFIQTALAVAKSTGYLPSQSELQSAVSAARGGMGAENFGSSFAMRRANMMLVNDLNALRGIAGDQMTETQIQIDILEQQLETLKMQLEQTRVQYENNISTTNAYYDAQLMAAQQQINTLNGINTSVLSVAAATNNLALAMQNQQSATNALIQANNNAVAAAQAEAARRDAELAASRAAAEARARAEQEAAAAAAAAAAERARREQAAREAAAAAEAERQRQAAAAAAAAAEAERQRQAAAAANRDPRQDYANAINAALGWGAADSYSAFGVSLPTQQGIDPIQWLINSLGWNPFSSGSGGAATGGYVSPGMMLVGEEGPELVNFRQPGMVYTTAQTQALMGGSGGGELAVEVRQLREENKAQSRAMVSLQARMTRIIERWDGDGIPTERYEGATA